MSSFMLPVVWLIAVILFVVLEVSTYQLVSVWFALGAVVALIASLFKISFTAQLIVFILVAVVSLAASRPMVKKIQSAPKHKTNSDRIIGSTAKVISPVSDETRGRIMVDGLDWSAAAANIGESFAAGDEVTVVKIEGVTAYVTKKS